MTSLAYGLCMGYHRPMPSAPTALTTEEVQQMAVRASVMSDPESRARAIALEEVALPLAKQRDELASKLTRVQARARKRNNSSAAESARLRAMAEEVRREFATWQDAPEWTMGAPLIDDLHALLTMLGAP